jgi:DNA-binding NarL/FixJ family response regulator
MNTHRSLPGTPDTAPVRIFLADDHEIIRSGLRYLIEIHPGWKICGEAATGRETVAQAEKLQPDIVIMDIGMPDLNGLDATRQLKRLLPKTEVLIFTSNETEEIVRLVFKAGARAYLLKSEASTHLIPALEMLRKHRTYFSSKVSDLIFSGYLQGAMGPDDTSLTPRERETVQLIAEGNTNKDMAGLFGISVKTVETHRASVMRKLHFDSVAALVRYAIRNGISQA